MRHEPYFSAGTNKYAYDQAYSRAALAHPRPSLLSVLWDRLHRPVPAPASRQPDGPVELMPRR